MKMPMERLGVLVAVAIVATACASAGDGSITTTAPVDPTSVLATVEQTGGCMMMGPNCPTYIIRADGQVTLLRTGGPAEPVDSTYINPALTTDLAWQMSTTDFTALRAGLPPGQCQGCYDGIDTTFVFMRRSDTITFDSVETELDPSEPLFATMWRIVEAASLATAMPLEERR
jgi:hypothetical protein